MTRTELEAEIMNEAKDQIERARIANYLGALRGISQSLGREKASALHARAGLLIGQYAETKDEETQP